MSTDALKVKSRVVREWRIHLRTTRNLAELAEWMNPIIRGWMDYYGTFYQGETWLADADNLSTCDEAPTVVR